MYTETHTIKIEGKPVNLVYTFHLNRGYHRWKLSGDIHGKVDLSIASCSMIVEDQFIETSPRLETLSGKVKEYEPRHSGGEAVAGNQNCFIFIPEKGSTGTVTITFIENRTNDYRAEQ